MKPFLSLKRGRAGLAEARTIVGVKVNPGRAACDRWVLRVRTLHVDPGAGRSLAAESVLDLAGQGARGAAG